MELNWGNCSKGYSRQYVSRKRAIRCVGKVKCNSSIIPTCRKLDSLQ